VRSAPRSIGQAVPGVPAQVSGSRTVTEAVRLTVFVPEALTETSTG
jgi:hypothetical protein